MKNINFLVLRYLPLLLCPLFFSACAIEGGESTDSNFFEYHLQGTWVSNDATVYSGTLAININSIKISGYSESQIPTFGNPAQRPFKDFVKDISLEAYSESAGSTGDFKKGNIFIKNAGTWQESIPYTYWEEYSSSDGFIKLLEFEFHGRKEVLRRTGN